MSGPLEFENGSGFSGSGIEEIVQLALHGLRQMYRFDKNAFCYRTELRGNDLVKFGISRTNTLITLIGIRKAEIAGYSAPVEMVPALMELRNSVSQFDSIGDLGLYLWLSSMFPAEGNPLRSSGIGLETVFRRFKDAREHRTMELAWFLAGASEAAASSKENSLLADLVARAHLLLKKNQEATGLFRHSSSSHSVSAWLRSRIGSFADQIFPIYALARFSAIFGNEMGLHSAILCAERLCELQGPLGQWWWHYDAIGGRVIGRYPVYSVHQDGMAPMAFFALASASGRNFTGPIFKGLNWIYGRNELGADLRDARLSVIWRSIHQSKSERYFEEARVFVSSEGKGALANRLRTLYECHPYHLGWILFAFAGRDL